MDRLQILEELETLNGLTWMDRDETLELYVPFSDESCTLLDIIERVDRLIMSTSPEMLAEVMAAFKAGEVVDESVYDGLPPPEDNYNPLLDMLFERRMIALKELMSTNKEK